MIEKINGITNPQIDQVQIDQNMIVEMTQVSEAKVCWFLVLYNQQKTIKVQKA